MTVYIVTGHARCGSSLVMRCLEMGGMEATYNKALDQMLNEQPVPREYDPNPYGDFELAEDAYERMPDEMDLYEGRLIKMLIPKPLWLPAGPEYEVAFVQRDLAEIAASQNLAYKKSMTAESIGRVVDHMRGILSMRRDVKLHRINHRDLIERPGETLSRLAQDWPFDPTKAIEGVDKSLYRVRAKGQ